MFIYTAQIILDYCECVINAYLLTVVWLRSYAIIELLNKLANFIPKIWKIQPLQNFDMTRLTG